MTQFKIKWLAEPKPGNYPAALAYLRLLFDPKTAARHVGRLKRAPRHSIRRVRSWHCRAWTRSRSTSSESGRCCSPAIR